MTHAWSWSAVVALVVLMVAAATPATSAAAVPTSLTALESSAEDLVDAALARDRTEVVATARKLRALAAGQAAASLARAGVSRATVDRLQQRARHVDAVAAHGAFIRVALAANAVSGLMPDLYARFHDRVPPAVLALDYLDREAQLRAVVGERDHVADAVKRLGSTWRPLRPKVITAGGAREAAAYDKHVASMNRLSRGSLKKVRGEAVNGLNLVDQLEQVFTH
jgi:hypothetical protein